MDYVLRTNALCKHYKSFKALNGLSMNVPKGAIYGFVGKNGAGKTTLIRLICGLQEPTSGDYTLYGRKSTDKEIVKSRRRMGAVVENPSIYLDMTAEENLKQQYRILGLPSFDGLTDILKLVGLEDTGKKKAKNFSLGMRQRLGIAIALVGDPDFLVLDEPVNGLDPQGIIEIREFSDGAIRNKLIVGHKRTDIYWANLLSCFVGCIIIFLAWALGGLAGIPYFGLWSVGLTGYFELLLIELLSVFAITAVLVLEAQLITNKATSVVVTIFSAFGMLLLSSYFYNAICEPETTVSYVKILADGMVDYGPEIANPAYIGGTLRTVYQVLLHLLPPGQQIWIADETVTHPLFMCICSFIVIIISTVIGLFLFRKKDLK